MLFQTARHRCRINSSKDERKFWLRHPKILLNPTSTRYTLAFAVNKIHREGRKPNRSRFTSSAPCGQKYETYQNRKYTDVLWNDRTCLCTAADAYVADFCLTSCLAPWFTCLLGALWGRWSGETLILKFSCYCLIAYCDNVIH